MRVIRTENGSRARGMGPVVNTARIPVDKRALWKGYIHIEGFDMPVKLYPAVREERIPFHLLHARDGVRLKQQLVCAHENIPVPLEEQTRGFESEKGTYILISPADLEKLEPEDSRMIDVHEFVGRAEIDPLYLDRTYHLEPDAESKGYRALARVMEKLDVSGICTWTMRKRSYLGALQVSDHALRLCTLRYADEVVPVTALDLMDMSLTEKELKIGMDLISQMSAPFEPWKFENEHQKKLQELINKKARGEKIAILRPRRLKMTPPDKLLKTLEASLKKVA
jgi:DNA end-binding protein Ku